MSSPPRESGAKVVEPVRTGFALGYFNGACGDGGRLVVTGFANGLTNGCMGAEWRALLVKEVALAF